MRSGAYRWPACLGGMSEDRGGPVWLLDSKKDRFFCKESTRAISSTGGRKRLKNSRNATNLKEY